MTLDIKTMSKFSIFYLSDNFILILICFLLTITSNTSLVALKLAALVGNETQTEMIHLSLTWQLMMIH